MIEADKPEDMRAAEQLISFAFIADGLPAGVLFGDAVGDGDGIGEVRFGVFGVFL